MGADDYVIDGTDQEQPQWTAAAGIPSPSRPWQTDVFSCFQDVGLCCDVLLCYPCMQGRLFSATFDQRPDHMHPLVCCSFVSVGVMDWAGDMMRIGFLWWMRSRVREIFRLEGSAWMDCLTAIFCGPCITCQMHRELSAHGINPGYTCCQPDNYEASDVVPNAVQPGYNTRNYGTAPPTAGSSQPQ
ncbi:hypothetical protein DIPPA_26844 [Diplonema papillatum]|nr:hypothetical protein DIPPA_26844 [Diplonema papillatum]|eukprot:gene12292-19003_t